jgi:hypothetical protein
MKHPVIIIPRSRPIFPRARLPHQIVELFVAEVYGTRLMRAQLDLVFGESARVGRGS